jgi:hypothetical protein
MDNLHPDDSRELAGRLKERMPELQIQVGGVGAAPPVEAVAHGC